MSTTWTVLHVEYLQTMVPYSVFFEHDSELISFSTAEQAESSRRFLHAGWWLSISPPRGTGRIFIV